MNWYMLHSTTVCRTKYLWCFCVMAQEAFSMYAYLPNTKARPELCWIYERDLRPCPS